MEGRTPDGAPSVSADAAALALQLAGPAVTDTGGTARAPGATAAGEVSPEPLTLSPAASDDGTVSSQTDDGDGHVQAAATSLEGVAGAKRDSSVRASGQRGRKPPPRGVGNGKPPARSAPPVVVLLAGLPGSGKSTFCRSLMQASPVAWVHINQDAINNGRPGKREQCLAAARLALDEGACCLIDRCHTDTAQRGPFVALAAERGVAAHCVTLTLPAAQCATRVAGRTDHPGGVQGDSSKRVVYQMAKQQQQGASWPPAAAEGFASVMDCRGDADAAVAVRAWAAYAADAAAPALAAGSQAKPAGVGGSVTRAEAAVAGQAAKGAAGPGPGPERHGGGVSAAAATLAIWEAHAAKRKAVPAGITAFFKPAAASKAAPGGSAGGSGTVHPQATAAPRPPPSAAPAAAAAPASMGAAPAAAATAAAAGTHKRQGGTPGSSERGGKRHATNTASGATHGDDVAGAPGGAKPAQAAGSPSAQAPQGTGSGGPAERGSGGDGGGAGPTGRNAFAVMLASSSRQAAGARTGAKGTGASGSGGGRPTTAGAGDVADRRFKLSAPWAQALRNTALHPEQAEQQVLYQDEQVVMIVDAFPKARYHALVLARDPGLRSIADLRQHHVPLLKHMRAVAENWVRDQHAQDPSAVAFKVGFHAVPSMCQLHMHVVSQDFDSRHLKNKKHWNSFTTRFFLPFDKAEEEVLTLGRLVLMSPEEEKELEKAELRCHACPKACKTLPELKTHIAQCDAVKRLPGI